MSASVVVTLIVMAVVIVSVVRQHRQNQSYFEGQKAAGNTAGGNDASYAQVMQRLQRAPLACVQITPVPQLARQPWQSKFGGQPYWPMAMPYPRDAHGKPLYLLAQINFAETPALPGYPHQGLLQFFVSDDDLMGLQFGKTLAQTLALNSDGSRARVVFHEQVLEQSAALQTDLPSCEDAEFMPLTAEYALAFSLHQELAAPTDHRFEHLLQGMTLSDSLHEQLYEELSAGGSKLGGYANFTQDDPRHAMLPGKWLLLFQMDSAEEEGVELMWGDCGVANWFIRPDDLARRDFSQVWYNWDCS